MARRSCGTVLVREQTDDGSRRDSGTDDGDSGDTPQQGTAEIPYIGPLTLDNERAVGAGLAAALGTGLLLSR